jgi:DNA-binding NtrC family response regulator
MHSNYRDDVMHSIIDTVIEGIQIQSGDLASPPKKLLDRIVEQILSLTGATGGSLGVFESRNNESHLFLHATEGTLPKTSSRQIKCWERYDKSEEISKTLSGFPVTEQGNGGTHVWVTVIISTVPIAYLFLQLSPSAGRHAISSLSTGTLQDLESLLLLVSGRLLLAHRMSQLGMKLDYIATSKASLVLERRIRLAAMHDSIPILIIGERGTGKDILARLLHLWSPRWRRPFVPVLAPALSEDLFLDELFGHAKHAFTGANMMRPGKFQAASGGTVFLDEMGDLSARAQAALLRTVENGEIFKIGCDLPERSDVRIIAATNRNVEEMVAKGQFRADLLDRLAVISFVVHPLRKRKKDTHALIGYLFRRYCAEAGKNRVRDGHISCRKCSGYSPRIPRCLDKETVLSLLEDPWLGNVRELQNALRRLSIGLPWKVRNRQQGARDVREPKSSPHSLESVVREQICSVLLDCGFNQSQAARSLGLPLSTLRSKMKRMGIDVRREVVAKFHGEGERGSGDEPSKPSSYYKPNRYRA